MAPHTLRRQIDKLVITAFGIETKARIHAIVRDYDQEKYIPLCLTKVSSETTVPSKRMLTKYNSFKSGRGYRLKRLTQTEERARFA